MTRPDGGPLRIRPLRLRILGLVVLSLFAALFTRLWYLQVLSPEDYELAADANRVRVVPLEAPRGRILDRNGTVLVDNRMSIIVTVDRVAFHELPTEEADGLVERLAEELTRAGETVTAAELRERIDDVRHSRFAPVPVAEDVPEQLKIHIEERSEDFPGVAVERTAVRGYPYGDVAAHVLGYVGEINEAELEARLDRPNDYRRGDQIGKAGVERTYERHLRGTPGTRRVEVDAHGTPVRVLGETAPVPGSDVWLTIDADVQAHAERALSAGLEAARARRVSGSNLPNQGSGGVVVVLDPSNGEVVAMASYPTFDPSEFVNGIARSQWEALHEPGSHFPLTNRAVQGEYAPGSTFKLVTGYAALVSELRDAEVVVNDRGSYHIPGCRGGEGGGCVRRNAGSTRYGPVDLRRALTVSSDVYFYGIGAELWTQRDRFGDEAIQDAARAFGLGTETGIALPSERSGRIPTAEQRRAQYDANPGLFAEREWYTGDNVNMAIGQGDVAVTPLQLANAYATFANGGTLFAPKIASRVTAPGDPGAVQHVFDEEIRGQVVLPEAIRQPLLDGLAGVTSEPGGTALRAFDGFPHDRWPVAGKTGTAEVDGKADTAVFTAFGPISDPRYQVTVLMEESGFGGSAAAPVARRIMDVFAGVVPWPDVVPGGGLAQTADPAAEVGPGNGSD